MNTSRAALFIALVAAASMPAMAQAQWIHTPSAKQPPPLYPYATQPNQAYAVQVSPGTYVIHRPDETAPQPRRRNRHAAATVQASKPEPRNARARSKVDPALVAELSERQKGKGAVINTTQVVRDKPVVNETKRYVDLPPRVVERYVDGNGKPIRGKNARLAGSRVTIDVPVLDKPKGKDDVKRVINAEAEITIIGPDRMNIRLYRKGGKPAAD